MRWESQSSSSAISWTSTTRDKYAAASVVDCFTNNLFFLQLSTYALTLFRKEIKLKEDDGKTTVIGEFDALHVKVSLLTDPTDFWDTAGQEAFSCMHPSYYYRAHCCILVFDVTRKITYQHLADWYKELRDHCENIPCVLVANKIDVDYNVCIVSILDHLRFLIVSSSQ